MDVVILTHSSYLTIKVIYFSSGPNDYYLFNNFFKTNGALAEECATKNNNW